jgi:hypothetical protein
MEIFACDAGVSDLAIKVIQAPDFTSAVEDAWRRANLADGPPFTTKRLGGQVLAKNIPLSADGSVVEIIFDGSSWPASPTPWDQVNLAFFITHELTHPILSRLRHMSGALDGVPFPSQTPTECARSLVRGAIDELRCDLVADGLIRVYAASTPSGQHDQLGLPELYGGVYAGQLAEILGTHVYPGWPDLVDAYRHSRLTLDEMWWRLVSETDQAVTLLAHAQAEASAAHTFDPFHRADIDHPGIALYLGPAWDRVTEPLSGLPAIPHLSDFAQAEADLCLAGEEAILTLWQKLGITVEDYPDRSFHLQVEAPMRADASTIKPA